MSLDIYVWLAWRCHQLGKPTSISWPAVHAQFGTGFKAVRQFNPRFTEALGLCLPPIPRPAWIWTARPSPCIPPDPRLPGSHDRRCHLTPQPFPV